MAKSREVAVGTLGELTGSRKPTEPGSSTEHRTVARWPSQAQTRQADPPTVRPSSLLALCLPRLAVVPQ